ncbi:TetR/AcrR family transcriptional regulator [Cohnella caldifontis]|uniref:TetR/AcrR family transcriptional regulator n=1 Tax=Cohnella caldifontis TaxID=3027471 RepID=UPI0023EDFE31|nr:TetR/AcrR family transcriptional regulator [Cohnella sp. YIM B05605]
MPRPVNPQLRENRRRALLDAAVVIFSRQGFARTTVSEIAKAAGVSHASVFQYFATKEELFREAVLDNIEQAREFYRNLKLDSEHPAERLRLLVHKQIRIALNSAAYLRLVQQIVNQPQPDAELTQALDAFAGEFVRHLAELLEEGQQAGAAAPGDAGAAAAAYFAYWNGVGLISRRSDDDTVRSLAEHGLRLLGVRVE